MKGRFLRAGAASTITTTALAPGPMTGPRRPGCGARLNWDVRPFADVWIVRLDVRGCLTTAFQFAGPHIIARHLVGSSRSSPTHSIAIMTVVRPPIEHHRKGHKAASAQHGGWGKMIRPRQSDPERMIFQFTQAAVPRGDGWFSSPGTRLAGCALLLSWVSKRELWTTCAGVLAVEQPRSRVP